MVGFVAAALLLGLQLREVRLPLAAAAPLHALCGSERWSVKTLSDGDRWKVDLTKRSRTIAQLNALTKPSPLPQNGRVPAELKVYRVTATVT